MKTKRIGILGGMSPESTVEFYSQLVKMFQEKNFSTPEIVIFSLDLNKMVQIQESNDTEVYVNELMVGINALEKAEVDFAVIASNTPHMVFDELQKKSKVPLLSMVTNTAKKAKETNFKKFLLLGTKFTMQSSFYQKEFEKEGLEITRPSEEDQLIINEIIYDKLVKGVINQKSKEQMLKIIDGYSAEGVILGCTELPLILEQKDTKVIVLDTLRIHVEATAKYCCK